MGRKESNQTKLKLFLLSASCLSCEHILTFGSGVALPASKLQFYSQTVSLRGCLRQKVIRLIREFVIKGLFPNETAYEYCLAEKKQELYYHYLDNLSTTELMNIKAKE